MNVERTDQDCINVDLTGSIGFRIIRQEDDVPVVDILLSDGLSQIISRILF